MRKGLFLGIDFSPVCMVFRVEIHAGRFGGRMTM